MESKGRVVPFRLDIKTLGPMFKLPFIIMLTGALYVWLVYKGYSDETLMVHIRANFGIFSLPLICMWIFGLFQDSVESVGKETILCLPYRSSSFGMLRVLRMTSLYGLVFFIILLSLTLALFKGRIPFSASDYYLPVLSLFFFSSFSYALIVLTKNSLISYTIFCVFGIFQYMTRGAFSASVYPFQWSFPRAYTNPDIVTLTLLISTIILYGIAQLTFSRREYLLK